MLEPISRGYSELFGTKIARQSICLGLFFRSKMFGGGGGGGGEGRGPAHHILLFCKIV